MAELKFNRKYELVTNEDILAEEARFNISLPDSYKNFILQVNGGRSNKIYFSKDGQDYALNEIFPLSKVELSFENQFVDLKRSASLLPSELAAVGDDAFGNLICISLNHGTYGQVFFWSHENDGESLSIGSAKKLAGDFKEFLSMLVED